MNFWGFHPEVFNIAGTMFIDFLKENHKNVKTEFYIPLFVNRMILEKKGKVKVTGGGNVWFGVTYKEDKDEVSRKIREMIASGDYPQKLWS